MTSHEKLTIPKMTSEDIRYIRDTEDKTELDEFLIYKYGLEVQLLFKTAAF